MHWAARFNNVKITELLLNLGATYDQLDIDGNDPYLVAKKNMNMDAQNAI